MKSYRYLARFIALLVVLTLALFISYVMVAGQDAGPGADPKAPEADGDIYLPLISKPPNTIYGHVTDAGSAAPGVFLELWLYSGGDWSLVMTTTTDANGDYVFRGMPALSEGQKYLVEYFNDVNPTRLNLWDTRELTSLANGSSVNIGNFDIANVELVSPESRLLVGLPSTFQWTPRPATPSDRYAFGILDIYDYDPFYYTAAMDDASSYDLNNLPGEFQYCTPYFWAIAVYGPDGGVGASFDARIVTLYSATPAGIHGCVTEGGVPVGSVSLELFRYDELADACVSQSTTTTNASGYFAFTDIPNIELCNVRYFNDSNPSRLSQHTTVEGPVSYTSGNSVHIGDFDIANIPLVSPASGLTVPPTTTFWWTRRPNTLWDVYEFGLYDPIDIAPWFGSNILGYGDHYNLTGLPPEFIPSYPYVWEVYVGDLFDGWGVSYQHFAVNFSPTGLSEERIEHPGAFEQPNLERLLIEKGISRNRSNRTQAGLEAKLRRHPNLELLNGQ